MNETVININKYVQSQSGHVKHFPQAKKHYKEAKIILLLSALRETNCNIE